MANTDVASAYHTITLKYENSQNEIFKLNVFAFFFFFFFFLLRCQYIHVIIIIIIKSKFPLKENSLSCYWKNCTTRAFSVWNKNYYNFITPEHTSYSFPIINLSNKRVPSHTGKFLHVPSVYETYYDALTYWTHRYTQCTRHHSHHTSKIKRTQYTNKQTYSNILNSKTLVMDY